MASLHKNPPQDYEAKYILELLDDAEIITPLQFKLYRWIAAYYLCSVGEVLNAALPSGLKLSSESMVQINPAFDFDHTSFEFSEREQIVLRRLQHDVLTYTDLTKLLGGKSIHSILKSLVAKEAVILFEQVKEKFRPKTETHLRLSSAFNARKKLENLFEELASKPKQEAVVLKYLQQVPVFTHPELNTKGLSKKDILSANLSESSLGTLIKNKVFEEFEVIIPRFNLDTTERAAPHLLSELQETKRNELLASFQLHDVTLLHGITGSGKTEIYIDLIKRALESGSQVLYLLPEIALTTQIVYRLKKIFGGDMGVYHSKFSDNERVEVWNGVLNGKFKFIVGVRSSVFLPFDSLGLIIVDEEHDPSYKQHEPAPRYNARDVAMVMAQQHSAKVVLGSATPSVETYFLATNGKYGFVTLKERFGDASLPEITFANLTQERKRKTMKGEFSSLLLQEINDTITTQGQVILFQNRRGYSPLIQCQDCSWVPKCINCAVSLTYHQYRHAMICHYCGYREDLPAQCPTCSSKRIQTLGYGTEKLEEELNIHFPEAKIGRMDLDTTRTKSGYENILEDFESGATNILVGTQMVTKGLDFDRVRTVGVFDADRMMHFPDFRSYERAFQLVMQVSGRAGRRAAKGKVVIQTADPAHRLFEYITHHDVEGFLALQLRDRQEHFYPPYSRLIDITFKHIDKKTVTLAAQTFSDDVKKNLSFIRLMGPGEPMISKIRNEFLMTLLLKIGRDQGKLAEIKLTLRNLKDLLHQQKEFRSVKIVFDVDPH